MEPQTCSLFLQRNPLGSACPGQQLFGKKNGWGPIFSRLDSTGLRSSPEVTSGKARGLPFLNSSEFESTCCKFATDSYETFTKYDMINQAVVHFNSIYKLRDFSVSWMVSYGMSQYLK